MTTELPPLILLLRFPMTAPVLTAWRDASGATGGGLEVWPDPVPRSSLLVYAPARFPWHQRSLQLLEAVETQGGESLALSTVLTRLGRKPGRGLEGVVTVLAPGLAESDWHDPEVVATMSRELIQGLAALLVAEPAPRAPAASQPSPALLDDMRALPAGPGVYWFLGADGRTLYVGKARSLCQRVPQHFGANPAEPAKNRTLVSSAVSLQWEATGSDLEAILVEHRRIQSAEQAINRQITVRDRDRRELNHVLLLPSAVEGANEVCVVSGAGGFHWERLPRRGVVPRAFWQRLQRAQRGRGVWAPQEPGATLGAEEANDLVELTESWMARYGGGVTQLDLGTETDGRELQRRLRVLLASDPRQGRIIPV